MRWSLVLSFCLASFSAFPTNIAATANEPPKGVVVRASKKVADAIAMKFIETWSPEDQYDVGFKPALTETLNIRKGYTDKCRQAWIALEKELKSYEEVIKQDPLLEKEFLFTKDLLLNNLKLLELNDKYGRLTLLTATAGNAGGNIDLISYIFYGLDSLIIKGVDKEYVIGRLKRYVQGINDQLPIIEVILLGFCRHKEAEQRE